MKTNIHLISAPWANMFMPSIQLACMKAHLDRCAIGNIETYCHSAFAEIFANLSRSKDFKLWDQSQDFGEYTYGLLLIRQYAKNEVKRLKTTEAQLIAKTNRLLGVKGCVPLTVKILDCIQDWTEQYVDAHFSRDLPDADVHVFGFTLNYYQDTSSIYMAKRIHEKLKGKKVVFLFGGMGAAMPAFSEMASHFDLPAYGVLGEGESKIQKIAELLGAASSDEDPVDLLKGLSGVYSLNNPPNLMIKDKKMYEGQLNQIGELALPDFSEYFETIGRVYPSQTDLENFLLEVDIPMEGTRGCFAKCSFCGLNYLWQGFRKMPASQILERTNAHYKQHDIHRLVFMDNVCDTWAEGYADALIEKSAYQRTFMELRAHHPEVFWTKLALCGVKEIQIGIEALSAHVLKLINKGTTVAQNVLGQKYLLELGIQSNSNIIGFYPHSTPADVQETKELLEDLVHFPELFLAKFYAVPGSPIFETLSAEKRNRLKCRRLVKFPGGLARFGYSFGYEMTDEMLSRESRRAWQKFDRWYKTKYLAFKAENNPTLSCQNLPDGRLKIRDQRYSKHEKVMLFDAEFSTVYRACHAGKTVESIVAITGLEQGVVENIVREFTNHRLVTTLGGRVIALAIRNRDELIQNYYHELLRDKKTEEKVTYETVELV